MTLSRKILEIFHPGFCWCCLSSLKTIGYWLTMTFCLDLDSFVRSTLLALGDLSKLCPPLSRRGDSLLEMSRAKKIFKMSRERSEIWTSGEKWWYCFLSSFISRSLRIPSCSQSFSDPHTGTKRLCEPLWQKLFCNETLISQRNNNSSWIERSPAQFWQITTLDW